MRITRREFLKYCTVAAGALGLTATDLLKIEQAFALTGGLKVIWINGQACTGCTVSLANSAYYAKLQDLLLGNPIGTGAASTLDIGFMETLAAVTGSEVGPAIHDVLTTTGDFALVVEGAIPTADNGNYCKIGENWQDVNTGEVTIMEAVVKLATHSKCAAVLAVGTCAAFGGIPAAEPNPTTAMGILDVFHLPANNANYRAVRSKTINISGCPPNPNWIVGTIAYMLAHSLAIPSVDALRRPRAYYGERICNSCNRFAGSTGDHGNFVNNITPNSIGDPTQREYCLKKVGCKGSRTKSDCSVRKWHSPGYLQTGVNWCVGAGAPCQGCTQNYFPDRMSPFHYIK